MDQQERAWVVFDVEGTEPAFVGLYWTLDKVIRVVGEREEGGMEQIKLFQIRPHVWVVRDGEKSELDLYRLEHEVIE